MKPLKNPTVHLNNPGHLMLIRGITLVEVLVALLILGVGVMGFVALQLKAVDTTETTYSRSQAMAIARDVVERINANPEDWQEHYGNTGERWTSASLPSATACYGSGISGSRQCNSAQMAEWDVSEVRSLTSQMLFQGQVSVQETCADDAAVPCVVVAWGGTTAADCNMEALTLDGANLNANCVVMEFWPRATSTAQVVANGGE